MPRFLQSLSFLWQFREAATTALAEYARRTLLVVSVIGRTLSDGAKSPGSSRVSLQPVLFPQQWKNSMTPWRERRKLLSCPAILKRAKKKPAYCARRRARSEIVGSKAPPV